MAEGHAILRSAIRAQLESHGIDVVGTVANAEHCLSLVKEKTPDVLLLSLELPTKTGLDLLQEFSRQCPDVRVVALTNQRSRTEALSCFALGAWGYLTRDVAPDALARAVRSVAVGHLAVDRALAATLIRSLVHAVDESLGRRDANGMAGLTARELEVLSRVAAGLSDRAIAGELNLSPRTVEKHVSNTLRKLDCRRRADAGLRYRATQVMRE